jgi:hypothetical protein
VAAPLACGTAALAVTGGALVLVDGPALPTPAPTASLRLPVGPAQALVEPLPAEPRVADVADLVKGVQLAERQAQERTRQHRATRGDCGIDTSDLGAVRPHVLAAARFLGCQFDEPTMYGVAGRGGTSDHPSGRAVDFMVDRATGDRLAACALTNRAALGVTYVIWRQRINFGNGWQPMEDRGGVTANHYDHVHVSFGAPPLPAGGPPNVCAAGPASV